MQRTNPLQNCTADEEQGPLLAAGNACPQAVRQAYGDAIQRNGLNLRTHAPALKRHRPVWFGLPCTSCALTSTSSASVILHSLLTRTPRPARSRNCCSTHLNFHLISDHFLIRTLRTSAALENSPYKRVRLIKGFLRGLNPCWNVIVGLFAFAMTWGCPALNASVATGQLTVDPTTISFGDVLVGNSEAQSGTLTNSNGANLTISQVWVSGSEFQLSGLGLPFSLAPGQSATFNVTFTPTTLDFGSIVVGTDTSLPGTLSATGSSVTVSSATSNSSEFTLSGLSFPVTLAAGQSASFTFTFRPQASGTDTASISFISNASNSPTVVSLTGSGALSPLHSVDLSWSPSTSAVVGYNIYRSGTSDGPYAKINSALNATAAYTDNTVQAGVTYYYVTTAVDASGVESVYSNQAQVVVPTP